MCKIREWLLENWPEPISPEGRSTLPVWVPLIFLLVLLARLALHLTNPQLWVEDGKIFFMGAHECGFRSILTPYAGYCHLVPRLIAWATSWAFPLEYVPVVYFWATILIVFGVGMCWLKSSWMDCRVRAVMAFSLILVPCSGETFGNITNLQWFLSSLFVWVLLSPTVETIGQFVRRVLVVTVTGLSGPVLCAFLPFFLWRYFVNRRKAGLETCLILVVMVVVLCQVCTIFLFSEKNVPHGVTEQMTLFLWVQLVLQVPVGFFLGQWLPQVALTNKFLFAGGAIACLSAAIVVVYGYFWVPRHIQNVVKFLLLCGLAILGLSFYRYLSQPRHFSPFEADRYFQIPYSLWLSAVVLLMIFSRKGRCALLVRMVLVLVLTGSALSFFVPARLDSKWKIHIDEYRKVGTTTIPITPNPFWAITLRR